MGRVGSVVVDTPPPQSIPDHLLGIVLNRNFVCPTGYPERSVTAIPWAGLLSKSHSVSSPALSSLRLPVQQGTWTSAPCGDCWVGPAAAAPAAGFARRNICLASRISSSLGNFPVLWATKIGLEMQLRLTSPQTQGELQSWVVLTVPS